MSSSKRTTPFNVRHCDEYGLKVTQRDAASSLVVSVACRFCITFGREQKVGSKRRATTNVQHFTKPFRVDMYKKHMENQHPSRWTDFKSRSKEEKKVYFDEENPTPHANTIRSHFAQNQAPLIRFVDREIVDVIVGEMLFQPEDNNNDITLERALSIFEQVDGVPQSYRIHVRNPIQFHLVVDYVSVGASFRMASYILRMTKERTGLASIGCCSEGKVSSYIRMVCAINLQLMKDLLDRVWTFSIALDMSTHMATSYLDIRLRFFTTSIVNVHFLAIPMFTRHTALEIFNHASKALDVVRPDWKSIMISTSTDGERKMTGHIFPPSFAGYVLY